MLQLGDACARRIVSRQCAEVSGPFVLYAGRIDAGKGCAEMLAHHQRYRSDVRGAAELLLIGKLAMPEPRGPGVRYLRFLSEAGRSRLRDRLAGAARRYVEREYRWEVVLERYRALIDAAATAGA